MQLLLLLFFLQLWSISCGTPDFRSSWRAIDIVYSQNLSLWYQQWELCVLNSTSVEKHLKEIRDDCIKKHGAPIDKWPYFKCRVGGIYKNMPCRWVQDSPMSSRNSLKKTLKGYDDPSQRYMQGVIEILRRNDVDLLLLGDSMMKQHHAAITCELERSALLNTSWNLYATSCGGVNLDYFPLGDKNIKGWPLIVRHITTKLKTKNGLMILLNYGIHYGDDSVNLYKEHLHESVKRLNELTTLFPLKFFALIWFDTSAQHFNTQPNGYFVKEENLDHSSPNFKPTLYRARNNTCPEVEDITPTSDWRNRISEEILFHSTNASFLDNPKLITHIIPFRDLTLPLHDGHSRGDGIDCTHFCWWPMFYQPVFDEMNKVANRFEFLLSTVK